MRNSSRSRRAGPWVGALLALLAAGLLFPSTTRAGCSSRHAAAKSPETAGTARLELLELAGAIADGPAGMPGEWPAPCTGALCSGNPAVPLAPATPIIPPVTEQWALAAFALATPAPGLHMDAAEEADARPIGRPESVFHPPRPLVF